MLDSFLSDGTGLEFLEFAVPFVQAKRGSMPFVISMSGNEVAEQKRMYQSFRVNDFLQKPIKKQDLLDIMLII